MHRCHRIDSHLEGFFHCSLILSGQPSIWRSHIIAGKASVRFLKSQGSAAPEANALGCGKGLGLSCTASVGQRGSLDCFKRAMHNKRVMVCQAGGFLHFSEKGISSARSWVVRGH